MLVQVPTIAADIYNELELQQFTDLLIHATNAICVFAQTKGLGSARMETVNRHSSDAQAALFRLKDCLK